MVEHRWLTVVSKEEQDGPEVVLEPMGFQPAKTYQKALGTETDEKYQKKYLTVWKDLLK